MQEPLEVVSASETGFVQPGLHNPGRAEDHYSLTFLAELPLARDWQKAQNAGPLPQPSPAASKGAWSEQNSAKVSLSVDRR